MGDYINPSTRAKLMQLKGRLRVKTYGKVIDKLIELMEEHFELVRHTGDRKSVV